MKFGGSSVADAERIRAAAEIVRARLDRRPAVVVSALAGVTDLLETAIVHARRGELEALDPILADLERRHRWALTGSVESSERRHDLSLEIDALFDSLRQRLRSIRILGEGTPRAVDAVLAFGETLSGRIIATAFGELGLPACWIDPRRLIVTDATFGEARPDLARTAEQVAARLSPLLTEGKVPVVGGFVGATPDGRTTTLGRGGSDTSAAILGHAAVAEEIQIWTDVDGLMSADPKLVPAARTLPEVSFEVAAELAFYGAKVLHPASIAPAVRQQIPVRVLNSLRPDGAGTVVLGRTGESRVASLDAVASRRGVSSVRITSRRMRLDSAFLPQVLVALESSGASSDLVVSSEVGVTLIAPAGRITERLAEALGHDACVESMPDRALVCVVGEGMAVERGCRARVLAALAPWEPELLALGASRTSATAVVPESALEAVVRDLHRRFFEEEKS